MKRLILVLILAMAAAPLICDVTESQIRGWWESLNENERVEILLNYASIVNGIPTVKLPDYFAVIVNNDVIVTPDGTGSIKIGHLEYELIYNEMIFEDVVPEIKIDYTWYFIGVGTSLVGGFVLGYFVFRR